MTVINTTSITNTGVIADVLILLMAVINTNIRTNTCVITD